VEQFSFLIPSSSLDYHLNNFFLQIKFYSWQWGKVYFSSVAKRQQSMTLLGCLRQKKRFKRKIKEKRE
jgi:hypothetical protein